MKSNRFAYPNRSQLEEKELSWQEQWNKRINPARHSPLGYQTYLGHVYSLILENIAREGKDAAPNPSEFIDHLKQDVRRKDFLFASELSLETRAFMHILSDPIHSYTQKKGMNPQSAYEIMKEIAGNEGSTYRFSPKYLQHMESMRQENHDSELENAPANYTLSPC